MVAILYKASLREGTGIHSANFPLKIITCTLKRGRLRKWVPDPPPPNLDQQWGLLVWMDAFFDISLLNWGGASASDDNNDASSTIHVRAASNIYPQGHKASDSHKGHAWHHHQEEEGQLPMSCRGYC